MTDVIIYRQGNTVAVRDGAPPADQSAQVAQLTAALAAMTADRDAWRQRYEDATVPPIVQPAISGFAATPASITAGQSAVLNASVSGAVVLLLNGSPIPGLPLTVTPAQTMTYTLEATGAAGSTPATASLSITVAPVVVEPPDDGAWDPVAIYDPQDSAGMTSEYVFRGRIRWANKGGDWFDKDDTKQGSVPFGSLVVPTGTKDAIRIDCTALVQRGGEPQICVRVIATSGMGPQMQFYARESGLGAPRLAVTYRDGTSELIPVMYDCETNTSTTGELGQKSIMALSQASKIYLRFPQPARPITKAEIVLVVAGAINTGGRIEVYQFAVHREAPPVAPPFTLAGDARVFLESEYFQKGTLPYYLEALLFGGPAPNIPDAYSQRAIVDTDVGKAFQVTFAPGRNPALNARVCFPDFDEAEEAAVEFDIRFLPDLLTGLTDGIKAFAGPTSSTKSDDAYMSQWAKTYTPGRLGTLLAGNGGSKAHGNDGWSLRWDLWKSPAAPHPLHGRFLPMQYAYWPEQSDYYGDAWSWNLTNKQLVAGRWYRIAQRCRVNSLRAPTISDQRTYARDAEFDGYIDGELALRRRDFYLRTTDTPLISLPPYNVRSKLAIGSWWLNSYHGGTAQPSARCSFQVRNFRVARFA